MQRSTATPVQTAAPFFSSSFFGGGGSNNTSTTNVSSRSRPGTSAGDSLQQGQGSSEKPSGAGESRQPNVLTKDRDRRPSFGRRSSVSSPGKLRRRASSISSTNGPASHSGGRPSLYLNTDTSIPPPPALPDFVLTAAAAKLSREAEVLASPASVESFNKMLTRTATTPVISGSHGTLAPPPTLTSVSQNEASIVHQHIHEIANKRISTLDYLRKAYVAARCPCCLLLPLPSSFPSFFLFSLSLPFSFFFN